MRYIIELNGEEPTVAIEEILDSELGRNCICKYADYNKEYLEELAHNHCLKHGYSDLDEEDYINDETLTWGDIMNDIRIAYKAGYKEAMGE